MATKNSRAGKSRPTNGFRISDGPVIRLADEERTQESGDAIAIPRNYGVPILFATARDPQTIFIYWDVDWASLFVKGAPVDRQVHLRAHPEDGSEEVSAAVEPMAGNYYLNVPPCEEGYTVEIGYYQPDGLWNSVVTSEKVMMPAAGASEQLEVDVATIPFHLSFQRLIDMFRASSRDPLTSIISRVQSRAMSERDRSGLNPEEQELVRAMNLSFEEIQSARSALLGKANDAAIRRRTEAILGFGSSSPQNGFGASSWG